MNKKRKTGKANSEKIIIMDDRLISASEELEQILRSLCTPLTLDTTTKCWIIHLKELGLATPVEIIRQLREKNLQLLKDRFRTLKEKTTLVTAHQSRIEGRQNMNSYSKEVVWGDYKPPIEGSPIYIQNNTIQVTRRSLPCISVAIKHKLVSAIIDPAVSLSFICNDLYNIYVQSHYTEEEIRYSEGKRKKETAYCWWSQRRALVARAEIMLPITWDTTKGAVEDVIKLNLIKPNPGLINGFIVLGKDFYTRYLPSFCLAKNVVMFNLVAKRNLAVTMEMSRSMVTDYIPIADRWKGVVYFIDRYEKNCAYCRKNCKPKACQ